MVNWTITSAEFDGGPFRVQNLDKDKRIIASLSGGAGGITTLTADWDFFEPGHVGCLFRFLPESYEDIPLWSGNTDIPQNMRVRYNGRVYRRVDPASLIEAIDAGEFVVMGGERAQALRAQAVNAVAAQNARAEAEAKRARDAEINSARDFLRNGTSVMRRGVAFAGALDAAGLMQDPEIAALPEARELAATWQLMQDQPGLAVMTPDDKRAYLADLKAQPADRPFEVDRIDALEKMIAVDEKGFRDDPLTYAASIGLGAPPALPDPGTTSPQELGMALQARRNHAASLVS